jgi:hypothetical protein
VYQASERLHEKMTNFVSKNKAAQIQQSGRLVQACIAHSLKIFGNWMLNFACYKVLVY